MLVLTRKKDEAIIIGDDIEIIIAQITEDRVKIGIKAPKNMKVFRKELLEAVEEQNVQSNELSRINVEQLKGLSKLNK